MILISDRPPEIEDRAVPGHWEGDHNHRQGGSIRDRDLGGALESIRRCDPHSPWQRGSNENTNRLL
jgi:IS30 family transposase